MSCDELAEMECSIVHDEMDEKINLMQLCKWA